MSIPSRVLISSNTVYQAFHQLHHQGQSLQGFSYLLTHHVINGAPNVSGLGQSLQGFSYLLTLHVDIEFAHLMLESIPSRVLISSNTLSLQSRYLSMLIHHFAGQIYFSLYHPIHTYAKMSFSPVFMLCAADFTKYTSIMFSMSINLTIILYIMQVLLATV